MDPAGGWRYPHPRSAGLIISQGIEHANQICNAAAVLEERGESIENLLDAVETVLQARVMGYAQTGAILAGLWNLYFSWDSYWAVPGRPTNWGEELVAAQQIRSWVENNTVGVSLLGIRLSTSDAAITGTMFLLVLALYHCLCVRRENLEIGALLHDSQQANAAARSLVYLRLRSLMLMIAPDNDDSPFTSLATRSNQNTESVLLLQFLLRAYISALGRDLRDSRQRHVLSQIGRAHV